MPTSIPPVQVYAGDTVEWPTLQFATVSGGVTTPINLNTAGWGTWQATWKSSVGASTSIALTVDSSDAANGNIKITASSANTRAMLTSGVWDLQAVNGATVKTWAYGVTIYTLDVTP